MRSFGVVCGVRGIFCTQSDEGDIMRRFAAHPGRLKRLQTALIVDCIAEPDKEYRGTARRVEGHRGTSRDIEGRRGTSRGVEGRCRCSVFGGLVSRAASCCCRTRCLSGMANMGRRSTATAPGCPSESTPSSSLWDEHKFTRSRDEVGEQSVKPADASAGMGRNTGEITMALACKRALVYLALVLEVNGAVEELSA